MSESKENNNEEKPLNEKQRKFAEEILKNCNDFTGVQAAVAAGYAETGARDTASRLMADPRIKKLIREQADKHLDDVTIMLRPQLVERSRLIGFCDVSNFLDDDNNILPKSLWPPGASAAVAEVTNEITPNGVKTRIKLKDDFKYVNLLAKFVHLVEKRPQQIEVTVMSHEERKNRIDELIKKRDT